MPCARPTVSASARSKSSVLFPSRCNRCGVQVRLRRKPVNGNYGGPRVRDRLCQIILRHRFLWSQNSARGHSPPGRKLRGSFSRLGRKRSQCPALPIEQLFVRETRCGMRRYFESLRPAARSAIDSIPDGLFLVRVDRVAYRWQAQNLITRSASLSLSPSIWPADRSLAASTQLREPCGS